MIRSGAAARLHLHHECSLRLHLGQITSCNGAMGLSLSGAYQQMKPLGSGECKHRAERVACSELRLNGSGPVAIDRDASIQHLMHLMPVDRSG